jgi:hypothetical protein
VKSDKNFQNRFLRSIGDFEGLTSIPNLVIWKKFNISQNWAIFVRKVISCVKWWNFSKSIFEDFWRYWRTKIHTKPRYLKKNYHLAQNWAIFVRKVISCVKWWNFSKSIFEEFWWYWRTIYQTSLFVKKLTFIQKLGHFGLKSDQLCKVQNFLKSIFRTFEKIEGLKSIPNLVIWRKINI